MTNYSKLPRVGVGCVVLDGQGRVLLVRRARPPGAGRWSIPGGHVELGEDLLEAATRELEEETVYSFGYLSYFRDLGNI